MKTRYVVSVLALLASPAVANDPWNGVDPLTRQWFETLMQPDHPRVSCCGEADAYEADDFAVEGDHYVAIITGYRSVSNIPLGTRIPVPNEKLKYDAGNPTGHGIIFIGSQGQVFCYIAPAAI